MPLVFDLTVEVRARLLDLASDSEYPSGQLEILAAEVRLLRALEWSRYLGSRLELPLSWDKLLQFVF